MASAGVSVSSDLAKLTQRPAGGLRQLASSNSSLMIATAWSRRMLTFAPVAWVTRSARIASSSRSSASSALAPHWTRIGTSFPAAVAAHLARFGESGISRAVD